MGLWGDPLATSRSTERPILSPRLKQQLADQKPTGVEVDPEVVQSWVDMAWLSMLEYHPKGITQRIIVSWWSRIRSDELERAVERLRVMRYANENADLSELQDAVNASPSDSADVVDLFAGTVRR